MSEFSRWLTRKYPEYLLEQDAPMQQNPPAQSAAEILRQRLQKRAAGAGGQGGAPAQQNQDAQAAAERLKQRMQQRQNAGTGANPTQPKPADNQNVESSAVISDESLLQYCQNGYNFELIYEKVKNNKPDVIKKVFDRLFELKRNKVEYLSDDALGELLAVQLKSGIDLIGKKQAMYILRLPLKQEWTKVQLAKFYNIDYKIKNYTGTSFRDIRNFYADDPNKIKTEFIEKIKAGGGLDKLSTDELYQLTWMEKEYNIGIITSDIAKQLMNDNRAKVDVNLMNNLKAISMR
jgi:hypothetical protein